MNRRAAEHQAQTLLKELEEEISELRQRSATRSQLVLSEDYLNFLKVQTEVDLPLRQHTTSYYVLSSYGTALINSLNKGFYNRSLG